MSNYLTVQIKVFWNVYKTTTHRAIKHDRTSGTARKQVALLYPFPIIPFTKKLPETLTKTDKTSFIVLIKLHRQHEPYLLRSTHYGFDKPPVTSESHQH